MVDDPRRRPAPDRRRRPVVYGHRADGRSNPEGFVNVGPAGTASPVGDVQYGLQCSPQYLFLVNGKDDNQNGWIDEGYDGVDNNGNGIIDDPGPQGLGSGEWETETWPPLITGLVVDSPYSIRCRPAPAPNAREQSLPTNVVIDASDWSTASPQRSRLPVDPITGIAEIIVYPGGSVVPTTRYGVPASAGMGSVFLHFWLAERSDISVTVGPPAGEWYLVSVFGRTGRIVTTPNPPPGDPFSAIQQGAQ